METDGSLVLANGLHILDGDELAVDIKTELAELLCNLDIVDAAIDSALSTDLGLDGERYAFELADACGERGSLARLRRDEAERRRIGRGALGNPWVFREINEYFDKGIIIDPPTLDEKCDILLRHIKSAVEYKGEYVGMREARKHTAYYLKGFKNAAKLRNLAFSMETKEDLINLIAEIKNSNL